MHDMGWTGGWMGGMGSWTVIVILLVIVVVVVTRRSRK